MYGYFTAEWLLDRQQMLWGWPPAKNCPLACFLTDSVDFWPGFLPTSPRSLICRHFPRGLFSNLIILNLVNLSYSGHNINRMMCSKYHEWQYILPFTKVLRKTFQCVMYNQAWPHMEGSHCAYISWEVETTLTCVRCLWATDAHQDSRLPGLSFLMSFTIPSVRCSDCVQILTGFLIVMYSRNHAPQVPRSTGWRFWYHLFRFYNIVPVQGRR